ncbi:MAG: Asp-tRNA(Asn)/Glu-tRNA(Gln) amidotransferase subunit GatB, partial [Kiritimatiellia bacterium]|nr:Asp-tRNA(Asn)/Glu-tRNA(Gln) amidotransferase subunit GatB [Kiritimatiellia bacterium]
ISACNLEQGNLRCDLNVSVRPAGQTKLGVKAEIKNMNTFKGVHRALSHEIERQIRELEQGGVIRQETRRWDDAAGRTTSMRTKEDAHDYRYFPDPDLLPVVLEAEQIERWRAELPELPAVRRARFVEQYGIPDYDAGVLTADRACADFFEATVKAGAPAKAASNWIMTETLRALAEREQVFTALRMSPRALAGLIGLVESGTINRPSAIRVFQELFEKDGDPKEVVARLGLAQVSDSSAVEAWALQAIAENPKSVEAYRSGKPAALQHLIGQVMRLSRGKANPALVAELLKARLADSES